MFLIDDLLKAPGKAVFLLFEELARKAQEEWLDDESVRQELQQIYALLDGGKISEGEFESREQKLLERLEQIARLKFQTKWTEKSTTADAEATVIEGSLTAGSFSDALNERVEGVSSKLTTDGPAAAEPSPSIASKFSLGPSFFQAVRPFLDLPSSSNSPFSIEPASEEERSSVPSFSMASTEPSSGNLPAISLQSVEPSTISSPDSLQSSQPETTERVAAFCAKPSPSLPDPSPSQSANPIPDSKPDVGTSAFPVRNSIGFSGAVESAMQALSVTRLKASSVTSVVSADDGWRVSVELVERKAVPDTNDLLGVYEVHVNPAGIVTRYERTRVRRRNDLTR